MKKARGVFSLFLLVCLMGLLSCSLPANTTYKASLSKIVVGISGLPQRLDPNLSNESYGGILYTQLFSGLTRLDENGNIVPYEADHWEISSDGIVYTFYLKKDLKWSNGDLLTAHDYVYGWKRLMNEDLVSSNRFLLKDLISHPTLAIEDADFGIQALSDTVLQVTLVHPAPYFLSVVSLPALAPASKKSEASIACAYSEPETYLSNGPFILKEVSQSNVVKLIKNPNYIEASEVKIDEIILVVVEDDQNAFNDFGTQKLDVVIEGRMSFVDRMDPNTVMHQPNLGVIYYMFNMNREPFADLEFRKLLSMGINRQNLVNSITQSGETPLISLVPNGVKVFGHYFRDSVEPYMLSTTVDKEVIAAQLSRVNPKYLNKKYVLSYYSNPMVEKVAQFVTKEWKDNIGVEFELEEIPWDDYLKAMKEADYDMAAMGITPNFIHPLDYFSPFLSQNDWIQSQFLSPRFDSLYKQVCGTLDPQLSLEGMHQLEDMLINSHVIMPLYQKSSVYYVNVKLKGLEVNSLGLFYFGYSFIASE